MQEDIFVLDLENFNKVQLTIVSYVSKCKCYFSFYFVVSYEFLKNLIYSWAEVNKITGFPVESYC